MLRLPLVLIADAIDPQKARVKVVSDKTDFSNPIFNA